MPPRHADPVAALLARAERDGECLVLKTSLNRWGYPHVRVGRVTYRAHRWLYDQLLGLPEGADVHHRCGNRACLNIEHLAAVDPRRHRQMHARRAA